MIYLNNAATTFPKPQIVVDEVSKAISSPPFHSSRTGIESDSEDLFYQTREKIAKLIGAKDPNRIAFSSGSTESLNLAIKGLNLRGGHVVSTAIEHNSVIRPLKTMELDGEIELDFVPCDSKSYVEPDAIRNAMKDSTKAVVVNHCSNVTGAILDIEEIAKIAHERGCPIIVDASQSAGALPIDVAAWDIDLLAFTGHKSLYGLPGIGGLYVKEGVDLKALKVGGTGVKSEVLVQPPEIPMYFEAGTPNLPGVVSLNAGIGWINEIGFDVIKARKQKHVKRMIAELKDVPEITLRMHDEKSGFSNFCFTVDGMVPEEVGYALESSFDIVVRTGLHCAPLLLEHIGVHPWGTVRASPSYFTTDEEVGIFIEAMKEIVESFARK